MDRNGGASMAEKRDSKMALCSKPSAAAVNVVASIFRMMIVSLPLFSICQQLLRHNQGLLLA